MLNMGYKMAYCSFATSAARRGASEHKKNVSYTMFIMIMKIKSENHLNYFRKE